uniref:Transmembrane protein 87A n=1 Tax=Noccaea caerulescens TaxID=107243 RepID=A0A1J3GBS7_NOCCA
MDSLRILVLLAFATFFGASTASIHKYNNEGFSLAGNARSFHGGNEAVYASTARGLSFVRFEEVTFVRTFESARKHNASRSVSGLVEAILFERQDRLRIGDTLLENNGICCTAELADTGSCSVGEVIIRRDDLDWPRRIQTFFQGNQTVARMSPETVGINKSGNYELYFMICDKDLEGTTVSGRSIWMSSGGYLPAKEAPLLSFFGFMAVAYLLLGLLWFLRVSNYMTHLQHQISLIIALGMFEMAIQYFHYADFNVTGVRPVEVTLRTVTFSAARKTICWFLLLLVSMGYGVIKPTQQGITPRVVLAGLFCFFETLAFHLAADLEIVRESGQMIISLLVPVTLVDVCLIFWIFSSLAKTLTLLQSQRDMVKLRIYRDFTNTIGLSVIVSTLWIPFEIYVYATDMSGLQGEWIITAFWHFLSFALLAAACFIWSPVQIPRAAYHRPEETTQEDGVEEAASEIELPEMSTQRRVSV